MHLRIYILFGILLVWTSSCKLPDFASGEKVGFCWVKGRQITFPTKTCSTLRAETNLRLFKSTLKIEDIEIKDLEIMLINGDVLKPSIESTFRQHERSRIIDLAADGRQLEKIIIVYRADGKLFSRKGKVQIGGRPHNPNDNN